MLLRVLSLLGCFAIGAVAFFAVWPRASVVIAVLAGIGGVIGGIALFTAGMTAGANAALKEFIRKQWS